MPLSDFSYSEDVGTITKVIFGILSPDRIKLKSVCEIYKHITSYKNLEGTLMDPRLGPIERGQICTTCAYTYKECNGHFGHVNLAKPVYLIQYLTAIIKLLGCFCNRCSAFLLNKHDPTILKEIQMRKGKGRFSYVLEKAAKVKACPNCAAAQPKYSKSKEGIAVIQAVYKDKNNDAPPITINPEIAHTILKRVSDEDVELCGLNPKYSRPEWAIWTVMPVPPPAMRPSVKSESGKVSDDDLTHKLNDIIKFNNQLRIKLDEPTKQSYIDDCWQVLQYHVATYIDNEISNIPKATHRSGRPLKTIRQRIKAKEGRFRGNLMGKRVDGSARSVITADPNLSLDEVGVPEKIARNLTYPEYVTPYNITQMTQLVRNGPNVYPGAKSFKRKQDGAKKNLKFFENRDDIKLEPGDIVYRHLMDNDWVLFNRQPSLHKMSMMAHRAKVLPGNTFRLNPNVCSPYNADFDGDEMNLHLPQTLEAVMELKYLASVATQIVSPQSSQPVMGLIQDSLLGINLFTKKAKLTLPELMRMVGWINSYSGKLPFPKQDGANPRWGSEQMMSLFLPPITYTKKFKDKPDADINIQGGHMTSGILDKSTVGSKGNSLFHITWNDYGPLTTRDFFDNINNIANLWLQMSGFSVGISDCFVGQGVINDVSNTIKKAKIDAVKQIESVNLGTHEAGSDPKTIKDKFPTDMITLLNGCRGAVEKITHKGLDQNNAINTMVTSGSKGNANNIVQIVSMLGFQEVEGTWITEQLYRRTLPHFHRDNLTPEAHGFVENSFMSGLSPSEYWFHAQAGRVGIISKAIKTAETGYIQRKLIKAMEDLRVCYDGTVRNANGIIIQTVYGNDGFDASYHENQKLTFLNYNKAKLEKEFKHLPSDQIDRVLTKEAYDSFIKNQDRDTILTEEFAKLNEYYNYLKNDVYKSSIPENVKCPINFARMILNVANKFDLHKEKTANIDPVYIVQQVNALRKQMVVDPNEKINYCSTILINSLMITHLSSKSLIYKHKFNKVAFDYLIKLVFVTFMRVLINPGDNVGLIAAQSIGEPATQMTLDTFHNIGSSSKVTVSSGVPRLRELLNLTHNLKTPSITAQVLDIYLENAKDKSQQFNAETKKASTDKKFEKVQMLAAEMEYTSLEDLLVQIEIHYDEDDHKTCITEDQEAVDSYYDLLPTIDKTNDFSKFPWLLRMELDREAVMRKHIPLSHVEVPLRRFLEGSNIRHTVIFSDDNACKLICRIKVEPEAIPEGQDPISFLRSLEKNLLSIQIKGILGIDKAFINTVNKDIVLPDGTIISPFDLEFDKVKNSYDHSRYVIDTEGSNLVDVLSLSNIDKTNTMSNNVWEIYEIYGIEAARESLIHEISAVLEKNGTYISPRHIELLVDVMTNQGTLISVDRHGVGKTESGPLHRASFEETTTQLTNASIHNEEDLMTGVSDNIMFGQFVPTGTCAFRLALDIDKIKTIKPPKQNIVKPKSEITISEASGPSDNCNPDNFQFTFKMNNKLN